MCIVLIFLTLSLWIATNLGKMIPFSVFLCYAWGIQTERMTAMRYDFESIIDRSNCGSSKWEGMKKHNPNVSPDVIPLSVADMEFLTAPEIREGLKAYIDTVIQGYTSPTQAYYDAVLSWQRRRHGFEGKQEWIVTTSGVVTAIFSLVTALTQPGEGVIIQRPVYYPFSMAAEMTGRKLVINELIEKEDTYEIDFADLEAKCQDPNNKVLIFCNPHNPIGKLWSMEEIRRLVEICVRNSVFIIDDEIHNDLILPGHTHYAMPAVCPEALDYTISTPTAKLGLRILILFTKKSAALPDLNVSLRPW